MTIQTGAPENTLQQLLHDLHAIPTASQCMITGSDATQSLASKESRRTVDITEGWFRKPKVPNRDEGLSSLL